MSLDPQEVAQYLIHHPEFFEQHSEVIAELSIPNPHEGHAISLAERQQMALRDKNRLLETKLRELILFGEENDAIGEKVHRLCLVLLAADGLDGALDATYFNLREDFGVPHTAVRMWTGEPGDQPRAECTGVSIELCALADELTTPRCGSQATLEVQEWFGEVGAQLRSFAFVPLRTNQAFGLMVMASEDAQRFYPEMGTLYLQRIGELLSAALAHHLN